MASSRRETSPNATINLVTPGPSSETINVSMQGMMKEMVRLMQNMAKGENGHEEVIDLSQVPKAGSCGTPPPTLLDPLNVLFIGGP